MPNEAEVKYGQEIGNSAYPTKRFIWRKCIKCGAVAWKMYPASARKCNICAHQVEHPRVNSHGYIVVRLSRNNTYIKMAPKSRDVLLHRLIMAQHIGRPLTNREEVHHKNGTITDNRIDNLELLSRADHNLRSKICGDCELRKEIRLLQWTVKELVNQLQGRLV